MCFFAFVSLTHWNTLWTGQQEILKVPGINIICSRKKLPTEQKGIYIVNTHHYDLSDANSYQLLNPGTYYKKITWYDCSLWIDEHVCFISSVSTVYALCYFLTVIANLSWLSHVNHLGLIECKRSEMICGISWKLLLMRLSLQKKKLKEWTCC